jgi:hypothetical protein
VPETPVVAHPHPVQPCASGAGRRTPAPPGSRVRAAPAGGRPHLRAAVRERRRQADARPPCLTQQTTPSSHRFVQISTAEVLICTRRIARGVVWRLMHLPRRGRDETRPRPAPQPPRLPHVVVVQPSVEATFRHQPSDRPRLRCRRGTARSPRAASGRSGRRCTTPPCSAARGCMRVPGRERPGRGEGLHAGPWA